MTITVDEKNNILCFILRSVLNKQIQKEEVEKKVNKLKGVIEINVGRMHNFVKFSDNDILLSSERLEMDKKMKCARISGKLNEFINIVTGKNPFNAFFKGKIKISGDIFFAYKFWKIFKT